LAFESHRLLLRCPQRGDGELVHASVVESLEALRRFPASFPWAMDAPSVKASEEYCADAHERYLARTAFPFLIMLKDRSIHVGSLALHDIDWSIPKCEIGYWGRSTFTGQGLITEAVKCITAIGLDRLGMRRIEALPEPDNLQSRRLCERAGYELEGTLRNYRITPAGILKDACVYAIVR
jgi:RimJ/RimL family protein N-acetyltransferase